MTPTEERYALAESMTVGKIDAEMARITHRMASGTPQAHDAADLTDLIRLRARVLLREWSTPPSNEEGGRDD